MTMWQIVLCMAQDEHTEYLYDIFFYTLKSEVYLSMVSKFNCQLAVNTLNIEFIDKVVIAL
jgi:hypothetical protein